MDFIGNRNLFTSEFIIGSKLPINTELESIKTLHNWIRFKDNDPGMYKYRTEITLHISFLHIIDLQEFEEILKDIVLIYKKSYPHGEKNDFIKYIFFNTRLPLEKFVGINDYEFIYYGPTPEIENAICYYYDDNAKYPIVDFILEPSKDIDHYKQYYYKIIELINNLDFDGIVAESILNPPKPTETENDKIKVPRIALIDSSNEILQSNLIPTIDNIQPINNNEPKKTNKEELSIAEKYLYYLNGKNLKNDKYLNEADYKRLIEYTNLLFDDLKLPSKLKPIKSPHFRDGELRYSFYLMFKEKYPNLEYQESIFNFLSVVFPQLKDKENRHYRKTANYKKFNYKPQYWEELMNYNK